MQRELRGKDLICWCAPDAYHAEIIAEIANAPLCEECHGAIDDPANREHAAIMECMTCGTIHCPHGEPLHYHHDGCPACYFDDGVNTAIKEF